MADAVAALGETPFDIQMGTADAAGAALQATFVIDADAVAFQPVNIGRAKIKAGLVLAFVLANFAVDYL